MSFWDPYDRYNRERRRRSAERRRQAAQELNHVHSLSPELVERFQKEIAQARRERDEWADRYRQVMESLAIQQQALEQEREKFELEVEAFREQMRAEGEVQRERLRRNAEQRAFNENKKTLTRLLEVIDNFERALAQSNKHDDDAFIEGIRLTYRAFMRVLEQAQVTRLESIGQPFDPSRHEAVAVRPSDEVEDGTVLQEISPGYLYRGVLLRPAKVIIAQESTQ
ncbi:MAG: nucleotide exchange factor GrpE [Ardenticatenaceae bacterium]